MYSKYKWGDGLDIPDGTYESYTVQEAEKHLEEIRQHIKYCAKGSKTEDDDAHQWYLMTLELHSKYDLIHRQAHPDSYIKITYPQLDRFINGELSTEEVGSLHQRIIRIMDIDFDLIFRVDMNMIASKKLYNLFNSNLHKYDEYVQEIYKIEARDREDSEDPGGI